MNLLTQLKELGYSAKLVNGTSYDIDQDCRTHFLSPREATELALAQLEHPVMLREYAEWGGLNWWYRFEGRENRIMLLATRKDAYDRMQKYHLFTDKFLCNHPSLKGVEKRRGTWMTEKKIRAWLRMGRMEKFCQNCLKKAERLHLIETR